METYTVQIHRLDGFADEDFDFSNESAALAAMDEMIRDECTRQLVLVDETGQVLESWSRAAFLDVIVP